MNAIPLRDADALWTIGFTGTAYGFLGLGLGTALELLLRLARFGSRETASLSIHSGVSLALSTLVASRQLSVFAERAWLNPVALLAGGALGLVLAALWRRVRVRVVVMTAVALASLPLAAALAPHPERDSAVPPQVMPSSAAPLLVIGIDGFDPDVMESLISRGELPNIARLVRNGAYSRLGTLTPTNSPAIWTTIATGQMPDRHGILGFVAYSMPGLRRPLQLVPLRTGFVRVLDFVVWTGAARRAPVTTTLRRAPALWNIATLGRRRVGVVNWWPSWPSEAVDGILVSDRFWYGAQAKPGVPATYRLATTHPPELERELRGLAVRPEDVPEDLLEPLSAPDAQLRGPRADLEMQVLRRILAADLTYQRVSTRLLQNARFDLFLAYFRGADILGHLGYRVTGTDTRQTGGERFQKALENYYRVMDARVGALIELSGETTNVVLCSDHGFDWMRPGIGHHEVAKPGILVLHGPTIRPSARLQNPRVEDLAPTLLRLLGLPVARDMPGRVLLEAIDPASEIRSVSFIDSYGEWTSRGLMESQHDEEIRDALKALGYIGGR